MRAAVKTIMAFIDRILQAICSIFPRCIREGFIIRFHRLWTYGFFGCINTAIDYGLYSLLYYALGAPVWLAQAVGLIVGSSNGYLLNSSITFEEGRGRTKGQYFQYVGVDIVLAVITSAFMQWAEGRVPVPMILIKVCMTAFITVIHYILYKKVVFKIKKEDRHDDKKDELCFQTNQPPITVFEAASPPQKHQLGEAGASPRADQVRLSPAKPRAISASEDKEENHHE